jgi:hypothetical protein
MELRSTLKKFGYAEQQVVYRIDQMQAAFPEAIVDGYRGLIDAMKNDAKDRHVLAAAIKCGADCIVSSNKKHFPESALKPFELECFSADEFLVRQYHRNPDLFITILKKQAADINWTLPQLLAKHVPSLSGLIVTAGE